MIAPRFPNAVRRAIRDVADGNLPPSALRDPVALHQAATLWNDDFVGPGALLELGRHPVLARGTLLMMFWRAAPGYYQRYADRNAVPEFEREGFDNCQALAALYLNRDDLRDGIAYDPRDDDGEDRTATYDDLPRVVPIPPPLLRAVPGDRCAEFAGIDALSRPPTTAERAAIDAAIARGRALLPGLAAGAASRDVAEAVAAAMRGGVSDDALAWTWLDALGWPWRCGEDSATGAALCGVARDGLTLYAPDIVRRTVEAGVDPADTVRFFDRLRALKEGVFDHDFWDDAADALARGWAVATG